MRYGQIYKNADGGYILDTGEDTRGYTRRRDAVRGANRLGLIIRGM